MRFLRTMTGVSLIFKRFRIGFTLIRNSFKAVFLSHQHYFLFCILLALIQFIHLKIMGVIHHRFTLSAIMTELLTGESFFEILGHNSQISISKNSLVFLEFITLLYLEIILVLLILCMSAYYSFNANNHSKSIRESIRKSFSHWRLICAWGSIELCAQAASALSGEIGGLVYFVWNLVTIFDIQILVIEHVGVWQILKKSWQLFKKNFREIVVLDIIIEGALIISGFMIFTWAKKYISDFHFVGLVNYNDPLVFLILYVISSAMVLEVVVFTSFYKELKKRATNES